MAHTSSHKEHAARFLCSGPLHACLAGFPRQLSYTASNQFLDGLAHSRRLSGLPALSLNYGATAVSRLALSPLISLALFIKFQIGSHNVSLL